MYNIKTMRNYFLLKKLSSVILLFVMFSPVHGNAQNKNPLLTDSVKFRANMSYMIANGTFHPSEDTVRMNSYLINANQPVPMYRVDTSAIYYTTIMLTTGLVYPFHYSIRHSGTTLYENADTLTRLYRVRDTLSMVTDYFDNYNPATVPMTFNCDMYYQIRAGHFNPLSDYLDIAGSFNNGGAYDVLYPSSPDSMYTVTLFLDTALYQNPVLSFKFRFNGNNATEELSEGSDRTFTLHDTTGMNPDVYTCWYDNIDPRVPALPIAYDVAIQDSSRCNTCRVRHLYLRGL